MFEQLVLFFQGLVLHFESLDLVFGQGELPAKLTVCFLQLLDPDLQEVGLQTLHS